MLDKISWPVVALASVVVTAVVILGLNHVDTSAVTNVVTLLGLGGGVGVLMGVRNNVNGNLAKLIDLISSSMDKLAASQPLLPPDETKVP